MKTTIRLRTLVSLTLAIAILLVTTVQAQRQTSLIGKSTSATFRTKHNPPPLGKRAPLRSNIAPLRSSDIPRGVRVTLIADVPFSHVASYDRESKFVIVIQNAAMDSTQNEVHGRGIVAAEVGRHGDDVTLSFQLEPGVKASVNRKFNKLEIVFTTNELPAPEESKTVSVPDATDTLTQRMILRARVEPNSAPQVDPVAILNSLFPGKAQQVTADTSNVDLSVPESPAFTVLGFTPNTVVRPGTPRDFATSLLNGLDQNGNFQTGLAIDTAPFMLFNGENVTILDYNKFYLTRLLSRTQFSFAVTKGASKDDTATRMAAGLNFTLWDEGDARVFHPERGDEDVLTCFSNRLQLPPIIPPLVPLGPNATPEQIAAYPALEAAHNKLVKEVNEGNKAANDKVADECRKNARKANWNRSSWVIAYAPSWLSKTGESSNFRWNGGAFWTSLAYGFESVPSLSRIGQLIFHARYRTKERVSDAANTGQFLTQDSAFIGVRFRAGNPAFGFNIEDSYIRNKPNGRTTDTINRFSVGAEARLADNMYFIVTAGGNIGRDDNKSKGFLMTSFKYGFNKKSQFNPQP